MLQLQSNIQQLRSLSRFERGSDQQGGFFGESIPEFHQGGCDWQRRSQQPIQMRPLQTDGQGRKANDDQRTPHDAHCPPEALCL